jgi:hypothetical protein
MLACRGGGVDRLLRRPQSNPFVLQLVHDGLQVLHRARQAIDAGDDKQFWRVIRVDPFCDAKFVLLCHGNTSSRSRAERRFGVSRPSPPSGRSDIRP